MYNSDRYYCGEFSSDSSLSDTSDTDNDSDDPDEGITVVTVGGKVVDVAHGGEASAVIRTSGLRNIHIGKGQCTIVGTSTEKHRGRKHRKKEKSPTKHHTRTLTDSRHPPSKDDLSHICNNIGRHWRKLGFSLGFSRGTVDGIEADFNFEGTYEMAWQTLLKWTRKYGDQARLCDLAQALDDIGQTELAMELPV